MKLDPVTQQQIIEEVNIRILELHTMFALASEFVKHSKEFNWQDTSTEQCLMVCNRVTKYVPKIEQTLVAMYNYLEKIYYKTNGETGGVK